MTDLPSKLTTEFSFFEYQRYTVQLSDTSRY